MSKAFIFLSNHSSNHKSSTIQKSVIGVAFAKSESFPVKSFQSSCFKQISDLYLITPINIQTQPRTRYQIKTETSSSLILVQDQTNHYRYRKNLLKLWNTASKSDPKSVRNNLSDDWSTSTHRNWVTNTGRSWGDVRGCDNC